MKAINIFHLNILQKKEIDLDKKLKPKEILMHNDYIDCFCPDKDCEWHGKCKDCISLHRYHATIPECLKLEMNN